MKNFAIICEYNLFHRGHLRQIDKIRRDFPDSTVTAVMSGDFVQRGDVGIISKYERAKAAAICGVDLTLELPPPWCFSCAELFVRGGVGLVRSLGIFDYLCFGSESGDAETLNDVSHRLCSDEFERELSASLDPSDSFILSREKAYQRLYGTPLALPPNDILAVEYLNALSDSEVGLSKVEPYVIKREGTESATLSRRYFSAGDFESLSEIVPEAALELYRTANPARLSNLGRIILYLLRSRTLPVTDGGVFGAAGGVGEYILSRADRAGSFEEFLTSLPNKSYCAARMRRTLLNMLLGVDENAPKRLPLYTTLLSANRRGCGLLRDIKRSGFPVVTKPADALNILTGEAARQWEFSRSCTRLYDFAFDGVKSGAQAFTRSPFITV